MVQEGSYGLVKPHPSDKKQLNQIRQIPKNECIFFGMINPESGILGELSEKTLNETSSRSGQAMSEKI